MYKEIDWLAITSISVASVQFGMTIYDIWKKRFGKRQTTGFDRVMKGETVSGWKLAIPRTRMDLSYQANQSVYYIISSINPEDQQDATTPLGSTVTLLFKQPLPGINRSLVSVYQYSLIREGAKRQLLQCIYETDRFKLEKPYYLTSRTIIWMLHDLRGTQLRYHVLLLDSVTRKTHRFWIERPPRSEGDMYLHLTYMDSMKRFHVTFEQLRTNVSRIEIYDVIYDVPLTEDNITQAHNNPVRPRSWSSISIPVGNRIYRCCTSCGTLALFVIGENENLAGDDICVSFDRNTWNVQTMGEWIASFRNTSMGPRYFNAIRDLISLGTPGIEQISEIPEVNFFNHGNIEQIGNAVLVGVDYQGILHRSIGPPPLKRLGAQNLFKPHPNLKVPSWEEEIGFKMIDGIDDGDDKDEVDVIYMN